MTHDLSQALSEHFGFAEFRAGRGKSIEASMAGRSAVARVSDGQRQVAVLSIARAAFGRVDAGGFSADRLDEGSSRCPSKPGHRGQAIGFDAFGATSTVI